MSDQARPDEVEKPEQASKSEESKEDALHVEVSEQIRDEFKIGLDFIRPWRTLKRLQVKLVANQRKNPKKVGDTLMFSTHQTILASFFKDRLSVEWLAREEEDVDRAEQLNALYEFDYDQMGKAQHDFGKFYDATGFGLAIEDWSHFDRDSLTPIPDLWDPLSFVFDPKATSINGNRLHRGATRFLYREVIRTKQEMKDHGGYFNLEKLDTDRKKTEELRHNQQARDEARGLVSADLREVKENRYYVLIQGYTWVNGRRYLVEAGNDGQTVVRLQPLKTDYWPIQDSRVYPDPHAFITPGCWDFTEDKQRARAVLQNYVLDAAKYDVLPMWLFDKDKIVNKNHLRAFRAGKFIEGKDLNSNSVFPLTKPTIHQFSDGIMKELELNAHKALATPEIQQGIMFNNRRTATEIAEVSANVETRYSLAASLFSLAEANTAHMWLDQYKRHFKQGIDKKTIRIIGAFGPSLVPLTVETFKFKANPDVRIESRFMSHLRKREQRNNMAAYGQVLASTAGANLRYFAKKMGRLFFSKDEVDRLLPPTIDEMRAEDENDKLNKNTLQGVVIEPTDDHKVHLEIHGKAADTRAKFAHIEAHKKAMMIQRNRPELFAGLQAQDPAGRPPQMPQEMAPATPQQQVEELVS